MINFRGKMPGCYFPRHFLLSRMHGEQQANACDQPGCMASSKQMLATSRDAWRAASKCLRPAYFARIEVFGFNWQSHSFYI